MPPPFNLLESGEDEKRLSWHSQTPYLPRAPQPPAALPRSLIPGHIDIPMSNFSARATTLANQFKPKTTNNGKQRQKLLAPGNIIWQMPTDSPLSHIIRSCDVLLVPPLAIASCPCSRSACSPLFPLPPLLLFLTFLYSFLFEYQGAESRLCVQVQTCRRALCGRDEQLVERMGC